MSSYENRMSRSKQSIKTATTLNPERGSHLLPITVFELPAEAVPENPNVTSLAQEIVFEEAIKEYQLQRQKNLERAYGKPQSSADKVREFNQWLNAETYEEWSKSQKDFEEIDAALEAAA